jgi:hypothetical protein
MSLTPYATYELIEGHVRYDLKRYLGSTIPQKGLIVLLDRLYLDLAQTFILLCGTGSGPKVNIGMSCVDLDNQSLYFNIQYYEEH